MSKKTMRQKMLELCWAIDKLPESEQQTALSVQASELLRDMSGRVELSVVGDGILEERTYQDRKHGTLEEHGHTVGEWLLILEKESDEAKAAWLAGNERRALNEILQVTATGVACMQQHGVVTRSSDAAF